MKLTEAKIKAITKGGRFGDPETRGLILRVSKARLRRCWIHRFSFHGRLHETSLGDWPTVSLKRARCLVYKNRELLLQGINPLTEKKRQAAIPTFRQAAEKLAATKTWKNGDKAKAVWLARLSNHGAALAGLPVDKVDAVAVLNVLTPLWTVKPELARKLRQQINSVMAWAVSHAHTATNPCAALDGALPRAKATAARHHKALHHGGVSEALAKIEASGYSQALKLLARFQTLAAVRPSEARPATWGEVEGRVWTIPANRMKAAGRDHRVPLSNQALAVLEQARRLGPWDASSPIFPSALKPGKPLSDRAMLDCFKAVGIDATPHGMRSSFRDWAADNGKDREVAEQALAHAIGNQVEQAYRRSDLFDRRAVLMQEWADYLAGATAEEAVNG